MNPKVAKVLLGLLGQIAGLLNGTIATSLKLISNIFLGGFQIALKFNDTAMAFSRQVGLTAKQAQAYSEVLTTRAKDLGAKYGIAAEEVAKLEKNLARATGRVLMLSNAEAERQIQINRTVGEETSNDFTQTIMRSMGGQLSTVQGAVSKAYATAAKKGLDAAGMAAKVGQNLTMANRLTFKNGIDGLTKMVALSEKLGFNVQSLESAAGQFMDLQDAIENAAKLSMLGGAAGAYGSNPLDMSYEANYDPEAFGERMTKMLGGYAQFDVKTGMAKMNAMSRDFVKGIADALHISLDEAVTIAKKQAEVQFKNSKFGTTLDNMARDENGKVDENKRDFLLNKAQYNPEKNQLEINGKGLDYYQNDEKGQKELADMMRFSSMSDSEIMAEQATTLKSIQDTLNGFITSIMGTMAEKIEPYMPQIQQFLGDLYNMVLPHVNNIAENVKKLIEWVLNHMPEIEGFIKTVVNAVGKVATFLTSDWWKLLGALVLMPMLNFIKGIWTLGSKIFNFFSGKSKATTAKPAKKGKGGGKPKSTAKGSYKQVKDWMNKSKNKTNGSWWKKGTNALKTLGRHSGLARGASKAFGWAGTALAVGEGAYALYKGNKEKQKIDEDATKSAEQKEREKQHVSHETSKSVGGAAGALAGSLAGAKVGAIAGALAGPLGAAVGGLIGGAIGGIGGYVGGEWLGGKAVADSEPHAYGGYVGGRSLIGDKINTRLDSGEAVVPVKGQWDFLTAVQDLKGALGMTSYLANPNANGGSSVVPGARSSLQNTVSEIAAKTYLATPNANGSSVVPDTNKAISTDIVAVPVGGKEDIKGSSNNQQSGGSNEVVIKDFNVNVSGTIKLEGYGNSQSIDVKSLLDDVSFISALKEIIKRSISSDINGGADMRDPMKASGYLAQATTIGRLPA